MHRQRDQRAGDAVELVADQQREDDQDRVDPQRDAEHLRRDDVALELLQRDEQQRPARAPLIGSWNSATSTAGTGPMIGPM